MPAEWISIPYGAIKSDQKMTSSATNNLISIPYGAIKRRLVLPDTFKIKLISIPYGAIKRVEDYAKVIKRYTFQFLMVRLKVYYYQTIYPTCGQFQFLMVRLKGFDKI